MQSTFSRFSRWTSNKVGSPYAFLTAAMLVLTWFIVSAFFFHFNNTSQIFINTATTIVTFLMIFLVQSSQNRDTTSIQLKLDELIHAIDDADNEKIGLERKF